MNGGDLRGVSGNLALVVNHTISYPIRGVWQSTYRQERDLLRPLALPSMRKISTVGNCTNFAA